MLHYEGAKLEATHKKNAFLKCFIKNIVTKGISKTLIICTFIFIHTGSVIHNKG